MIILKKYLPDERCIFYLRLSVIILGVAVSAAVYLTVNSPLIIFLAIAVISVTVLFYILYYIPQYFNGLEYCTDNGEIVRRSGVLFRSIKRVRLESVQSCSVISVPFSEYTGFNCLVLYFYGGRLLLPFLKKGDADELMRICFEREENNVS